MNLAKKSQLEQEINLDGFSVPTDVAPADDELFNADQPAPALSDEAPVDDNCLDGGEDVVLFQVGDEPPQRFSFELPPVPGGEYQDEIEEPAEIEVAEEDEIEIVDDPWSWQVGSFLNWLSSRMSSVPQHSGRDSVGIERAMAYLEAIDREISKAVRSDINGEIDISAVEKARDELYKGLENLQSRLEKIQSTKHPKRKRKGKKKAEEDSDMVKEAQKATHVGGIIVTVPLLISSIARTCVNSMVSAGKDIEDVFDKLAEKYDLTPREEMETMQLLADMGYHMRRPRGYKRDEEIDYTSTDNFDWQANYPG